MLHHLPHQDMVGNTHHDYFQGWTFPVPDDDIMSCEGQDSPSTQHSEDVFVFEAATKSLAESLQPQWVCRAATGSQQQLGKTSQLCAGEQAQITADTSSFGMTLTTFEGDHSKDSPRHHFHILRTTDSQILLFQTKLRGRNMAGPTSPS